MDNTGCQSKNYTRFLNEFKLEQKDNEIEPHNANLTQNLLNFICERFDYKHLYMISQTQQYDIWVCSEHIHNHGSISKRQRIMICFSI